MAENEVSIHAIHAIQAIHPIHPIHSIHTIYSIHYYPTTTIFVLYFFVPFFEGSVAPL